MAGWTPCRPLKLGLLAGWTPNCSLLLGQLAGWTLQPSTSGVLAAPPWHGKKRTGVRHSYLALPRRALGLAARTAIRPLLTCTTLHLTFGTSRCSKSRTIHEPMDAGVAINSRMQEIEERAQHNVPRSSGSKLN